MAKRREWLTVTIAEPFPLFYAHPSYPSERRRETARGPFYSPGSVGYHLPEHRAFVEWAAAGLREAGWTVTIGSEWR